MNRKFQFAYMDEIEAAKLMESFLLYGTKEGHYTAHHLELIYALTDMDRSFYFTRAYYGASRVPDTEEYVLSYGEKLALVRCTRRVTSECINEKWVYYVSDLHILAVHGETPFTQQQMEDMITFYIESNDGFEFGKSLEKEYPGRDLDSWNIARQHKLMLQNHEAWAFDLLAKEYIFYPLDFAQQTELWNCIRQYGNDCNEYKNAELGYALTDAQHSFWLTLCYYMSEIIKRCDEPDDYEYAVVTDKTAGAVHIWFQNGVQIKKIEGEIPLTKQELCDAVEFYERFHYTWQRGYTKMYGKISKRPDVL